MSELSTVALRVTGPDSFGFLQNQLSNDLKRLETVPEIPAAWCNPKGRVIWFGSVHRIDSGYALIVPADMAQEMVRRLTMYRFRSRVEFSIAERGTADPAELIDRGWPWIGPEQTEKFTAHMLNLDLLAAVSFDKGCYPGQEIVARTHYRGASKRRCFRYQSDVPVTAGDKVSDGARDVGDVVNAEDTALLAIVPVDSDHSALTVNGVRLTPLALPYPVP